jgi:hypothetical protein
MADETFSQLSQNISILIDQLQLSLVGHGRPASKIVSTEVANPRKTSSITAWTSVEATPLAVSA